MEKRRNSICTANVGRNRLAQAVPFKIRSRLAATTPINHCRPLCRQRKPNRRPRTENVSDFFFFSFSFFFVCPQSPNARSSPPRSRIRPAFRPSHSQASSQDKVSTAAIPAAKHATGRREKKRKDSPIFGLVTNGGKKNAVPLSLSRRCCWDASCVARGVPCARPKQLETSRG